jgi:N-acylneuraminate cytidylyltransferase
VQWLREHDQSLEYACCIYATAPFLSAEDLRLGWELITKNDADYAFSVTSYDFPIQRAVSVTERGRIQMFHPDQFLTRSQDLDEALHDAGQFYWGKASAWLDEKMIFSEGALPVYIPRSRVQDIDTQEDWDRAEWIFRAMKATQQNGEQ